MKKFNLLMVFCIFVSVLPSKSEASALPRPTINHKWIQSYFQSPLQMRGRSSKTEKYENTNVRKSNVHTIPVYVLISQKSGARTLMDSAPLLENLFDERGMIYITNPKANTYVQPSISILDSISRRSSPYQLSSEKIRALRTYVNQELNKQLLAAQNVSRRFNEKYDKEYNFNDLVL